LWPRCYVSKLDAAIAVSSVFASCRRPPLADAAEVHPRIGSRLSSATPSPASNKRTVPRRFSTRLIQRRIGADEIADHIPRGDVQGTSAKAQRQRDRHCGQNTIRCAPDFCRGLIPTVCANM